jgi:hypothetical protein
MGRGGLKRLAVVVVAAAVASVALVVGVSQAMQRAAPPAAPGGPPPGAPLDHFVCYHVTQPAGQPKVPSNVQVADEFTTDATGKPVLKPVIVGGPSKLCAPISKYVMVGSSLLIYPALHPTLHLVCFRITEPNATPPVTVKTDNQFNPAGQQRILTTVASPTTGQTATSLCLPSHKSANPTVFPTGEPLNLLSHFKCYTAKETEPTGTTVPGLPAKVWAQDQFSPTPLPQVTVVAPTEVCNPAEKLVTTSAGSQDYPPVNPNLHLVCFSIRGGITVNKQVAVDNQFNPPNQARILNVGAAYQLCAPSFKQIIAPPPS